MNSQNMSAKKWRIFRIRQELGVRQIQRYNQCMERTEMHCGPLGWWLDACCHMRMRGHVKSFNRHLKGFPNHLCDTSVQHRLERDPWLATEDCGYIGWVPKSGCRCSIEHATRYQALYGCGTRAVQMKRVTEHNIVHE